MTDLERQLTTALERLSAQPAEKTYHGRESYKSNWDCTICVSCCPTWSTPAAQEWRGKQRQTAGIAPFARGGFAAIRLGLARSLPMLPATRHPVPPAPQSTPPPISAGFAPPHRPRRPRRQRPQIHLPEAQCVSHAPSSESLPSRRAARHSLLSLGYGQQTRPEGDRHRAGRRPAGSEE